MKKLIKNQDDELCFRLTQMGEKCISHIGQKFFLYVRDSPKNYSDNISIWIWLLLFKKTQDTYFYRQQVPLFSTLPLF